jgi:hypothetical protein
MIVISVVEAWLAVLLGFHSGSGVAVGVSVGVGENVGVGGGGSWSCAVIVE